MPAENRDGSDATRAPLRVIAQRGTDQFLVRNDPNSRGGYLVTAGNIMPTRCISQLARGYWDSPRLSRAAKQELLASVLEYARSKGP